MTKKLSVLEKYTDYEVVIGVEVHVQLNTDSKIFCSCKNGPAEKPNTNICEVCTAQPGALPLLNKKVVDYAIMAGLAIDGNIERKNSFDRKHYFYADLPKGYQITQDKSPIVYDGFVEIEKEDSSKKKIRIRRIHMEEDAGKNIHKESYSLVDLNRAGTPLLEIVTYPDISSTYELRSYLKNLHARMVSLKITSGSMEEGAFRVDTNISVRKKGETKLGTKCELKNINSFKFICDATEYEIERQIKEIEAGEKIIQQTRLWDTKEKITYAMRSKEDAADYRYMNEPDVPVFKVTDEWIEDLKKKIPELPHLKKERFIKDYELSSYEAEIIVDDEFLSDYFEKAYNLYRSKQVISWILREMISIVKEKKILFSQVSFSPDYLVDLIKLIDDKKITQKMAKDIFKECFEKNKKPSDYVKENNLEVVLVSDEEVENILKKLIDENKSQFEAYKSGKDRMKGFFIGKLMSLTKGAIDPKKANDIFEKISN